MRNDADRRIAEKELVIPALLLIRLNPKISTSKLIVELEAIFKPSGKDLELAKNRKDTRFAQKVRNLKSHNTISPYVIHTKNVWELNEEGDKFLANNQELVESYEILLSDTSFEKSDFLDASKKLSNRIRSNSNKEHRPIIIDENELVREGIQGISKKSEIRSRSKKLREAAIEYFKKDDKLICDICGFEFTNKYGDYGKDFIEIHHKKPICQYTDEDFKKTLQKALENLIPLCPNCHRMVHKASKLTFEGFKNYYEELNKNPR